MLSDLTIATIKSQVEEIYNTTVTDVRFYDRDITSKIDMDYGDSMCYVLIHTNTGMSPIVVHGRKVYLADYGCAQYLIGYVTTDTDAKNNPTGVVHVAELNDDMNSSWSYRNLGRSYTNIIQGYCEQRMEAIREAFMMSNIINVVSGGDMPITHNKYINDVCYLHRDTGNISIVLYDRDGSSIWLDNPVICNTLEEYLLVGGLDRANKIFIMVALNHQDVANVDSDGNLTVVNTKDKILYRIR